LRIADQAHDAVFESDKHPECGEALDSARSRLSGAKTCNFDLAWELDDGTVGIAEVKSNTEGNEAFQVRHGLGQVLDYGHRVNGRGFLPKLFLVLEAKPRDPAHWKALCAAHDVTLTWAPWFAGIP
jgi:hypothetical protein